MEVQCEMRRSIFVKLKLQNFALSPFIWILSQAGMTNIDCICIVKAKCVNSI